MGISDIFRKEIGKIKSKSSLHDYGFQLKTFDLLQEGKIEYARWLHPIKNITRQ